MPMSVDVNLPKDHTPRFPDRCVVCGEEKPDSTVKIKTDSSGWWSMFFWWMWRRHATEAPACKECGRSLHRQRFGMTLMTAAVVGLVLFCVFPMFEDMIPRAFRKYAFVGVVILCLLPQIIYRVANPLPFYTTAYRKSVDYEFRERLMAFQFANMNQDAKWVKVNGEFWGSPRR